MKTACGDGGEHGTEMAILFAPTNEIDINRLTSNRARRDAVRCPRRRHTTLVRVPIKPLGVTGRCRHAAPCLVLWEQAGVVGISRRIRNTCGVIDRRQSATVTQVSLPRFDFRHQQCFRQTVGKVSRLAIAVGVIAERVGTPAFNPDQTYQSPVDQP